MTYPPTGPHGQSQPYRPQGSPGSWTQPATGLDGRPQAYHGFGPGGPQPPAGYPGAQPPGGPAAWPAQPGPWGQQDLWGAQPGAFSDTGGAPSRTRKTGLIIGIVTAAVLLVGGGVTATLLLTGKKNDTAASLIAPGNAGTPAVGGSPGTTTPTPTSTDPTSVAQALVQSINAKNIPQYVSLLCTKPEQGLTQDLKTDWDSDSTLHAGMDGEPAITGNRATVTVHLTYHGQSMTPVLNLKQQGSAWCADIPS